MAFLDVATSSSQEVAWFTDITVGEQMVTFKLDTGAEVTAISLFRTPLISNCQTPARFFVAMP